MKRILGILSLLLLITACDDGDLTVDVIDFSEVQAQKCGVKDVIYKIKDGEMLFLEIPATTFTEDQTPEGTPIQLTINSINKVTYRKYDGIVTANNICPTVPDATPNVTEQWNASAGIIQITATAVKTTNATNGATQITGYNYYIILKNVTFEKPTGPQTYETFIFGNYKTNLSALAFGFDDEVDKSSCDSRIFNFSGSETLVLDVADYPTLFPDTASSVPTTATISSSNKLTYKLFANAVNDLYFCTTPTPATPALLQEWNAVEGTIEVTTSTFTSSSVQHTIHFKNVVFRKGNSDFTLGSDYIFGSFITP